MFLFLQNLIFIVGNRSLCLNFSILLSYTVSILPNKGKGEDIRSVLEELLDCVGSSEKERMVDALALDADEGRGKLRKATGSRKQTSIRRCPNVGTH